MGFLSWLFVFVFPILLGCWIHYWSERSMCKGEDKGVSVGFFLGWFLPSAALLIGMIIGSYCMLSSDVKDLDNKITNPNTGLAVLHERLKNHLDYHQQAVIVLNKMYGSASEAEKTILTKDASLFLTSPALFREKHKDLDVVKQFESEINALNAKMKSWENASPPK